MGRQSEVESRAQRPEVELGDRHKGGAGDLETQGGSDQLGGATEGEAKRLKGVSRGQPRN